MSFDPTLPAPNSEMRSEEMRNQFNGLKDLIDGKVPASEKGAANGVASLDASRCVAQPANWDTLANKPVPVPDGTYTMGFGTATNGTITVVNGIITAVQEATNAPVAAFVGSNLEDAPCNGNWYLLGTLNGKNSYRNAASNRFCSFDDFAGKWYIGAGLVPNQGNQSYFKTMTDDPPLTNQWESSYWLMPGTTA